MSRLSLDRDTVASCRHLAGKIAKRVQDFVDRHTTVSIERATLRLIGVEEVYQGSPLVNAVVDSIPREQLSLGVLHWIGRALVHQRTTPISICLQVAEGRVRLHELPETDPEQIRHVTEPLARQALARLQARRPERERRESSRGGGPLKYVIVATGNIHEDVEQAKAAVQAGADCIAVIRSTAQSLLDYVPSGATTEGFGGTFATQENFRIMREALDEAEKQEGRPIRLVNYSSGLCMPEIAVLGAVEGIDYLLNDCLYGILFRDINMKRTFTDQYFSRLVIAHAGITINTGEDNYLTTAESFRAMPQVVASQFINERLALAAHLPEERIGLGHAFEMDPTIDDSFLYEIAQAEMVREIFPRSPIKYMPPTRHMTGDIFFGHVLDSMFHLVGVMTGQSIQLLGMPTEGIHNPLLQDRFLALKAAGYIFRAARDLGDEIDWTHNGKVVRRARAVLDDAHLLLQKIDRVGIMKAISQGVFADMAREEEGGWGLDGVVPRDAHYWNPVFSLLERERPAEPEVPWGGWRRREATPGRAAPGRVTPGRATPGRVTPGRATPDRAPSPEATPGGRRPGGGGGGRGRGRGRRRGRRGPGPGRPGPPPTTAGPASPTGTEGAGGTS